MFQLDHSARRGGMQEASVCRVAWLVAYRQAPSSLFSASLGRASSASA